MEIFNTLSEKKEEIPSHRPLRLFVCGPTVYNLIHIGNARTFVAFDIFARYLRSRDIKVFYLQNITDVDDKIINRAAEEGAGWKEIARRYEKAYLRDLKALGINSVTKHARATDYIPQIVKQVEALIKKGHVYKIEDDGWYFDLTTFPEYGRLAHRTIFAAEDATSRIDSSDRKRNKGDFCVWKFSKPGEPVWKTELGAGRPGWHIEDTAITEHFFGPQYDIHGGAVDLKFPHHEAEIAQQESASGKKPMVRIWMHAGFLKAGGDKMSKSLGNFLLVEQLLARHPADIFRMAVIAHHYRSPMDWDETLAKTAEKNFLDIQMFIAKLDMVRRRGAGVGHLPTAEFQKRFHAAMEDDLNTPEALAAIMSFMNESNKSLWDASKEAAKGASDALKNILETWGFKEIGPKVPIRARLLAGKRERLRANKQFIQSDALRADLEKLGYRSEDTPLGPLVWPNR